MLHLNKNNAEKTKQENAPYNWNLVEDTIHFQGRRVDSWSPERKFIWGPLVNDQFYYQELQKGEN
jgi:hypothetical protein